MNFWIDIVVKWIIYILAGIVGLFGIWWAGKELFKVLLKLAPARRILLFRIFLILFTLLVGLSIATFKEEDYTNLNLTSLSGQGTRPTPGGITGQGTRPGLTSFGLSEKIGNKGGIVGAIISLWLCEVFGIGAWLIPLLMLLWGSCPKKYWQNLCLKSCFLIVITAIICFFISALKEGVFYSTSVSGGIVGDSVDSFLGKYLGFGKWFVALALIFILLLTFKKLRNLIFEKTERARMIEEALRAGASYIERAEIETVKTDEAEITEEKTDFSQIESAPTKKPQIESVADFKKQYLESLGDPEEAERESEAVLKESARILERKFAEFDISGKITKIAPGPVITRYEYEPAPGIKISRIASLSDDIAMSIRSIRIRIVAPIPGKAVIGIEVPNQNRGLVCVKEILWSETFDDVKAKLGFVLGKDIAGEPVCADLAEFPHVLIAGTTGSGKSVCINTMIASILYRSTPDEVRFLLVDPKRLELAVYNSIPHLVRPVISDAKESLTALNEIIGWMEIRYKEFARAGVRDIAGYNQKSKTPKPYIVVIIDELADLMLTAPREIEHGLTRLAQMSRAVGIHLVLATQRPSVDIITGLIKANFPARIAFQVASKTDSRTILDMNGAETLLGRGDMLFLPPGKGAPERLHGAYISTQESRKIADLWGARRLFELLSEQIPEAEAVAKDIVAQELIESIVMPEMPGANERIEMFAKQCEEKYGIKDIQKRLLSLEDDYYPELPEREQVIDNQEIVIEGINADGVDELFNEARELVIRHRVASVSLLQRQFKIGYARAGRLIDQLEKAGVVGPYKGSKSRDVIVQG